MKIFVALSGGVDSAVAALLLVQAGHEVVSAFMKNYSGDDGSDPCWIEDRRDAYRVAAHLGIPCITLDFEKEYRHEVLAYLYHEYDAGRTPNPDVRCNATIKFPLFWQSVHALGAEAIATGHYARIRERFTLATLGVAMGALNNHCGESAVADDEAISEKQLYMGADRQKDQSYFLHRLTQDDLSHTLFPVGHLTKPEVRVMARKAGIPVADKKSTRGICFVGRVDIPEFIAMRTNPRPGNLVRPDGSFVASHPNITPLTVGERGGDGLYVASKDFKTATVVVAPENHPLLARSDFDIINSHWIGDGLGLQQTLSVRIRSLQTPVPCTVQSHGTVYGTVRLAKAMRGVAPGQFAVFYDGETCLGGGAIA